LAGLLLRQFPSGVVNLELLAGAAAGAGVSVAGARVSVAGEDRSAESSPCSRTAGAEQRGGASVLGSAQLELDLYLRAWQARHPGAVAERISDVRRAGG